MFVSTLPLCDVIGWRPAWQPFILTQWFHLRYSCSISLEEEKRNLINKSSQEFALKKVPCICAEKTCKLQVETCKLQVKTCKLQVKTCKLPVETCKLQVETCKLQVETF